MRIRVEDAMTKAVRSCREDESLSCAARLMWDHDIGAVPVLGSDGKLVGIVTDRDLCMAAYFSGERMSSIPVGRVMSKVVFTVEPGQSVEVAEDLMREKQVRRLPVIDGGQVVGMITLGDLARTAKVRRQITGNEVSATLAAIVEPRAAAVSAAA